MVSFLQIVPKIWINYITLANADQYTEYEILTIIYFYKNIESLGHRYPYWIPIDIFLLFHCWNPLKNSGKSTILQIIHISTQWRNFSFYIGKVKNILIPYPRVFYLSTSIIIILIMYLNFTDEQHYDIVFH